MAGVVRTFCPACLRWSNDETGEGDDRRSSCPNCGSTARERFVTLLLGATARDAAGRAGRTVSIGARPPLATAIERVAADVIVVPCGSVSGVDEGTWSSVPVGDGTAYLVVCADVPRSLPDPDRLLGEIKRILSPSGMCILAFPGDAGSARDEHRDPVGDDPGRRDPSMRPRVWSDQAEASFAVAGFHWRRVVPQHTLTNEVLDFTAVNRDEPAWLLRRASSYPLPTTAEVAAGAEGEWFTAIARSSRLSELDLQRLREDAARSERALQDVENRLPVRLADAAARLARSVAGRAIREPDAVAPPDGERPAASEDQVVQADPILAEDPHLHNQGPTRASSPKVPVRAAEAAPSVTPTADSLLRLRAGAPSPVVRLLLHEFDGERVFAGVRTALMAGAALARRLDRPLRVVLLREPPDNKSNGALIDQLRHETQDDRFVDQVSVTCVERDPEEQVHADDIWMATYWTTAVAAGRACRAGILEPRRTIYLVQDFEPGFFGWSDDSAIAATTYREGFHLVVNSRPLARYLHDQTGVPVPADQVFAPTVNVGALERAAARWRPDADGHLRVLFYGRPGHPRNLFRIGLDSLRIWLAELLDSDRPVLRSAGADHPPYLIGSGRVIEPLGKLSMDAYLDLLSRTDLTLALMFSPHPSHLSLEPPIAGIPTVTNRFGSYREPWVEGLHVAEADPAALAGALEEAAREAHGLQVHRPQPLPASLGGTLDDVIRAVTTRL